METPLVGAGAIATAFAFFALCRHGLCLNWLAPLAIHPRN
jgi:hypothetical protein